MIDFSTFGLFGWLLLVVFCVSSIAHAICWGILVGQTRRVERIVGRWKETAS